MAAFFTNFPHYAKHLLESVIRLAVIVYLNSASTNKIIFQDDDCNQNLPMLPFDPDGPGDPLSPAGPAGPGGPS